MEVARRFAIRAQLFAKEVEYSRMYRVVVLIGCLLAGPLVASETTANPSSGCGDNPTEVALLTAVASLWTLPKKSKREKK